MAAVLLSFLLALAPGVTGRDTVGGSNGVDQGDFQMPFPCGEVWGASTHADHPAVDWNGVGAASGSADYGLPVLAGLGGTVFAVGFQSGYGERVIVYHGDGWGSLYGHLSAITVAVGDRVTATSQIGNVGNSGTSSGAHLHWEQRFGAQRVEPLWANGAPIPTTYGSPGPTQVSNNCASAARGVSVVAPPGTGPVPTLVATGPIACAPGGGCAYG